MNLWPCLFIGAYLFLGYLGTLIEYGYWYHWREDHPQFMYGDDYEHRLRYDQTQARWSICFGPSALIGSILTYAGDRYPLRSPWRKTL